MPKYLRSTLKNVAMSFEEDLFNLTKDSLNYWGASRVFVLTENEIDGDFERCRGFSIPFASVSHSKVLGRRVDKYGHGPGIFLKLSAFQQRGRDSIRDMAAVVLHEMAHILDLNLPRNYYTSANKIENAESYVATHVADVASLESMPAVAALQVVGHGSSWVRALIHLALRAQQGGWVFPHSQLCKWARIGFTDFAGYERLLMRDLERMKGQSLHLLFESPPDSAYSHDWDKNRDMILERYANEAVEMSELIDELKQLRAEIVDGK
jgi:hypothetical protein